MGYTFAEKGCQSNLQLTANFARGVVEGRILYWGLPQLSVQEGKNADNDIEGIFARYRSAITEWWVVPRFILLGMSECPLVSPKPVLRSDSGAAFGTRVVLPCR